MLETKQYWLLFYTSTNTRAFGRKHILMVPDLQVLRRWRLRNKSLPERHPRYPSPLKTLSFWWTHHPFGQFIQLVWRHLQYRLMSSWFSTKVPVLICGSTSMRHAPKKTRGNLGSPDVTYEGLNWLRVLTFARQLVPAFVKWSRFSWSATPLVVWSQVGWRGSETPPWQRWEFLFLTLFIIFF